jgi:5-methyltetrahydropteroyltriglutamate--homocysteine methyltransferase
MGAPYRADHVGSLLRPAALLEARAAAGEGRLTREALREAEDRAILGALDLQREVGIDVFTDGEYRRGSFLTDVADAIEGFVPERIVLEWHGPGGGAEGSAGQVVGARLRPVRPLTAHEVPFLQAHAPGSFKITVPAPSQLGSVGYKPGVTDRAYPTRSDLLQEFTAIVHREIAGLLAAGVPYIQMDAPFYTYCADPRVREHLSQTGVDPDQAFEEALAADAAALADHARGEAQLALHLCRGNSRSRWIAEAGYDRIAERLFSSVPVDRFLLEYDTERAGGFEPLRFVPRGKTVVLGLVTTKEPRLESRDDLLRRIEQASQYVPLEDLAVSPQCGFASVAAGNLLGPDDQRRKLGLLVETARRVWG